MGEETIGSLSLMFCVTLPDKSISFGSASLLPGSSIRSLKVKTLGAVLILDRKSVGKVSLAESPTASRYNNPRPSHRLLTQPDEPNLNYYSITIN